MFLKTCSSCTFVHNWHQQQSV